MLLIGVLPLAEFQQYGSTGGLKFESNVEPLSASNFCPWKTCSGHVQLCVECVMPSSKSEVGWFCWSLAEVS